MPNWCDNTLVINGEPERVTEFLEIIKSEDAVIDFDTLVPMPSALRGRKSPDDQGAVTWYEWSVENWGTKWNACDAYIDEEGKGDAVILFQTAWSPPVPWIEKVIKYFPWLSFELWWEEGGMGFAGIMEASNGEYSISEWDIIWDEEQSEYVKVS